MLLPISLEPNPFTGRIELDCFKEKEWGCGDLLRSTGDGPRPKGKGVVDVTSSYTRHYPLAVFFARRAKGVTDGTQFLDLYLF